MKNFFKGLSFSQLLAGALAAVTSFLLSAKIGIAGSIIGVAIGSVVSATASTLYKNVIEASGEKLQNAIPLSSLNDDDLADDDDEHSSDHDEHTNDADGASKDAKATETANTDTDTDTEATSTRVIARHDDDAADGDLDATRTHKLAHKLEKRLSNTPLDYERLAQAIVAQERKHGILNADTTGDQTAIIDAAHKHGHEHEHETTELTKAEQTELLSPREVRTTLLDAQTQHLEALTTSDSTSVLDQTDTSANGTGTSVMPAAKPTGRRVASNGAITTVAGQAARARLQAAEREQQVQKHDKRMAIIVAVVSALVAVLITAGVILLVTNGKGTDSVVRNIVTTTQTPSDSSTSDLPNDDRRAPALPSPSVTDNETSSTDTDSSNANTNSGTDSSTTNGTTSNGSNSSGSSSDTSNGSASSDTTSGDTSSGTDTSGSTPSASPSDSASTSTDTGSTSNNSSSTTSNSSNSRSTDTSNTSSSNTLAQSSTTTTK